MTNGLNFSITYQHYVNMNRSPNNEKSTVCKNERRHSGDDTTEENHARRLAYGDG